MEQLAAREQTLAHRLWNGLRGVPGLSTLRLWDEQAADPVGVASFVLERYDANLLATVLGVEHALGVRSGRFCAHPLMNRLLGISDAEVERIRRAVAAGAGSRLRGAVRASLGVGNTAADVDLLVTALEQIVREGPEADYELGSEDGRYRPTGGRPGWPELPFRLAAG
jgi:selenocysteine lyase/cysteine desulfurase